MKIIRARILIFVPIALVLSLFLAACGAMPENNRTESFGKTYEVAPVFREFYAALGGESLLGPAISKIFDYDKFECQYTVNALICQDPLLNGESRFSLYPLGNALQIRAEPAPVDPEAANLVVNGYTVFEEFIPVFDRLSGQVYAGNPITQVKINYTQQRIEQFFENVGMYRSFKDAPGTVNLMAYGVLGCAELCDYTPRLEAMVVDPGRTSTDQPFLPGMGGVENSTAFGSPLTQPYIANDGSLEQVYSSIIIFSPAKNTQDISLRPLPALLGIQASQPGPQQQGNRDGVIFYAVKGNLGFHVPLAVDEFIASHGGTRLSGDPISECAETTEGICRQCFENFCLLYQSSAPPTQQVTLAPLGLEYLELMQTGGQQQAPLTLTPETVIFVISELYEPIPHLAQQQLDVKLSARQDNTPLAGIDVVVTAYLPDGTSFSTQPNTTGSDGTISAIIPPSEDIANGSLIVYDVCLQNASIQPVCKQGSYLVFDSP